MLTFNAVQYACDAAVAFASHAGTYSNDQRYSILENIYQHLRLIQAVYHVLSQVRPHYVIDEEVRLNVLLQNIQNSLLGWHDQLFQIVVAPT